MNNIIFDLGGVILNLDYQETVRAFKKIIPNLDDSTFYGKENQLEFFSLYETGKITTQDFLARFNSQYNSQLSLEEFKKAWNAMLFDIPKSRLNLLSSLKPKRLFLLSNINEIHEDAVGDLTPYFEKVYYSHRIGLRKPNPEIFKLVLKENNLDLHDTLFIDDSEQHIRGAQSIGLQSIHLKKPLTIEDLQELK